MRGVIKISYYSKEVIEKVRALDLLTYLQNYEPDELVKICRGNYSTKSHDSLKISNGLWYWFSRQVGGKSALDYLIKVRDYSFTEAVGYLLNKLDNVAVNNQEKSIRDIELPSPASNNTIVINYLLKRCISKNVIQKCIDNKLIYQDVNNNVVFLSYDNNGNACYAMIRATNQSRYMREATNSNKAFSFRLVGDEKNTNLHLFESSIDLLSFVTLLELDNKNIEEHFLSLAGVYSSNKEQLPLCLNYYLNQHTNITTIYLHLDNDEVGRRATNDLISKLSKHYNVIDVPPVFGKDVNDFLCSKFKEKERER